MRPVAELPPDRPSEIGEEASVLAPATPVHAKPASQLLRVSSVAS